MPSVTTSIDEELVPYVEHFVRIFNSQENTYSRALRASFLIYSADDSPTKRKFDALLMEERSRLEQAIEESKEDGESEKLTITFEITGTFAELFKKYLTDLRMSVAEIVRIGFLSLSVMEDMLEVEPDLTFSLAGHVVALNYFFQEDEEEQTLQ